MVFDKQHLSLFVTLAFLLVYANAVPSTISNGKNVDRLRGDLHQFIEMILNCLTSSRAHSSMEPFQLNSLQKMYQHEASPEKSKEIENGNVKEIENASGKEIENASVKEIENANDIENTRKHGAGDHTISESEASNSEEPSNSEANEEPILRSSKEIAEANTAFPTTNHNSDEDAGKMQEFELQEGNSHPYTPRTFNLEITESESTERTSTINDSQDNSGSKEDTTEDNQNHSPTVSSSESEEVPSSKEDEKSASASSDEDQQNLRKSNFNNKFNNLHKLNINEKKINAALGNSNESKDKSESNTEEIQVRNFIQEQQDGPKFESGSSVHPYDALHIYGIQSNGPINKIVFEGGEHHPPRPLTLKESRHLKEFIRMVIRTNQIHSPIATFPQEDEIASRSGIFDKNAKKSPWADKPVPLELV